MQNISEFTKILECPCTQHGNLSKIGNNLRCEKCKLVFPIINNIPVMLLSVASAGKASDYYSKFSKTNTESIGFYNKFYENGTDYTRYNKADIDFIKKIFKKFSISNKHKILDIGAGTGYFGKLIKNLYNIEIYNADFSIQGFQMAKEQYHLKNLYVMDAYNLAFKPNTFDVVLAMGLTPFKKKEEREIIDLIKKTSRSLKKGGYYIFVWSTNLSNKICKVKKVKINTTDKKADRISYYYHHSRRFIINNFKQSRSFSEIKGYAFIRPLSFLFGDLLLTKFNTYLTEIVMKIAPKSLAARLLIIGKKK